MDDDEGEDEKVGRNSTDDDEGEEARSPSWNGRHNDAFVEADVYVQPCRVGDRY